MFPSRCFFLSFPSSPAHLISLHLLPSLLLFVLSTFHPFKPDTNSPSLYLAGLDPTSRMHVLALLEELHASRAPRIILGMRAQEELPAWVTHVLNVTEGGVIPLTRERWRGPAGILPKTQRAEEMDEGNEERAVQGELIVDLKGVGVKYGNRTVSKFSSAQFLSFPVFFFPLVFSIPLSSFRFIPSFRAISFLSACYRFFARVFFLFHWFSFLLFLLVSFLKFSCRFCRTSSILQVPFSFPEYPLPLRVDPSADDAVTHRFSRILRGKSVKERGGIYKGRMVGTSPCSSFHFVSLVGCFTFFSLILGGRNPPLHIFSISWFLVRRRSFSFLPCLLLIPCCVFGIVARWRCSAYWFKWAFKFQDFTRYRLFSMRKSTLHRLLDSHSYSLISQIYAPFRAYIYLYLRVHPS